MEFTKEIMRCAYIILILFSLSQSLNSDGPKKNRSKAASMLRFGEKHLDTVQDEQMLIFQSNETFGHSGTSGIHSIKHGRQKRNDDTCRCPKCKPPVGPDDLGRENIAWNKKAILYSRHQVGSPGQIEGACGAVNGLTETHSTRLTNCIHTSFSDPRPYWLLDLGKPYTLDSVITYSRDFETYVDDPIGYQYTVITVNGVIAFEYPADEGEKTIPPLKRELKFKNPTRGQWVMFQKKVLPESAVAEKKHMIVYCEIEIYVCPEEKYLKNGRCVMCSDCTEPCDNYYGCNKEVLYNVDTRKPTHCSLLNAGVCRQPATGRIPDQQNFPGCIFTKFGYCGSGNPYWRVDLGGLFHVYSVPIKTAYNYDTRFSTFFILVLKERPPQKLQMTGAEADTICYSFSQNLKADEVYDITCVRKPMIGQHVMIKAEEGSYLHLCDVKVMGRPIKVLGLGENCFKVDSINSIVCDEGLTCDKVCRVKVGESCRGRSQHCQTGSFCNVDTCRWMLGSSCTTQQENCQSGMMCESRSNKCKIEHGNTGCRTSDDCAMSSEGYTCDFWTACKKMLGQTCTNSEECIGGASCTLSRCQCNLPSGSIDSAHLCQPVCNASDTSAVNSCKAHASCNRSTNICECRAGYEPSPKDFTCVVEKAAIRASCQLTQDCKTGLICDNKKCRVPLKGICSADEDCLSNSICDDISCRYDAGTQCKTTDSCKLKTTCEKGTCRIMVGGDCTGKVDKCDSTTVCSQKLSSSFCLKKPGTTCYAANSTLCMNSAVCDSDDICRIEVGSLCRESPTTCQYPSQCENGRCKLIFSANCSGEEQHCAKDLTCDQLKECRIPKGGDCTRQQDGCIAGAFCNDNICECSLVNTESSTNLCDPKPSAVGGTCSPDNSGNQPCIDPSAQCDTLMHKCMCLEIQGLAVNRVNYTCKTAAGFSCSSMDECEPDAVCRASGICEVKPGARCTGRRNTFCLGKSFCDKDRFCRLTENENCTSDPTGCGLNFVCDVTFRCKIPHGKTCNSNDSCEAGTECSSDSVCQCAPGLTKLSNQGVCDPIPGLVNGLCQNEDCTDENAVCNDQDNCECQPGWIIDRDFSCKKKLDTDCVADEECVDGLSCDTSKKCKYSLGMSCDGKHEMCGTGAVCDKSYQCKLELGANCSGENSVQCMEGTTCDWLSLCKVPVGGTCQILSECLSGGFCNSTICICDTEIAKEVKSLCVPNTGRVGAECNEVSKACTTEGAYCESGRCRCAEGVTKQQDFTCALGTSAAQTDASLPGGVPKTLGIFLVVLAIAVIAIGAVLIKRRNDKKKADAVNKIKSERETSMAEINRMEASSQPEGAEMSEVSSASELTSSSAASESTATSLH